MSCHSSQLALNLIMSYDFILFGVLITAELVSKGFGVTSQVFLVTRIYKVLFPVRDQFVTPFIPISFKSHEKLGFYSIWCVNNSRASIKRFWGHIASISYHTSPQGAISRETLVCHAVHPYWLYIS